MNSTTCADSLISLLQLSFGVIHKPTYCGALLEIQDVNFYKEELHMLHVQVLFTLTLLTHDKNLSVTPQSTTLSQKKVTHSLTSSPMMVTLGKRLDSEAQMLFCASLSASVCKSFAPVYSGKQTVYKTPAHSVE